jgi:2,5-furandicarboxylate decarboxylase 1
VSSENAIWQEYSMSRPDTERFRLRRFVDKLLRHGECETCDEPLDLLDVAARLDGNHKAVWFRAVGPERAEMIGNVMGNRSRLALALDCDPADMPRLLRDRMGTTIAPVEIASADAPVHEVVKLAEDADFCDLPVHLQHGLDGAPYISAGIDFAIDPANGLTNVGCRRIMLRGPREAGIDLNAPSDLRAIYLAAVKRGEKLPVAYTVGSHPLDFLAALAITAAVDELAVAGGIRGEPVPVVKCKTIDVLVPADAEYVLEGYLDSRGLSESEGPYGEYVGYYGALKKNPVFHLTAITHRRDALFQTVTIGGRTISRTDAAVLGAAKTEAAVWSALQTAVRETVSVCATASSGGMYNVRLSLRQRVPGEARNAIASVFGSTADVKHVFVFDEDVDVFSDEQVDWAFATRFQADRDLVVAGGFRVVPLDPSLGGRRIGGKVGFDCTMPFGKKDAFEFAVPLPPVFPERAPGSVEEVLGRGPATYLDLMAAAGTRDGREIVRELGRLYEQNRITRLPDGRYALDGRTQ